MSSTELVKSARVRPAWDLGSNDFGWRKFTADTTHKVNAIPDAWRGQWVRIYVTGGDLHFGFSESSSAEIDRSVAATDAGASAKVGEPLKDGAETQFEIPASAKTVYFVREATATATVYVGVSS